VGVAAGMSRVVRLKRGQLKGWILVVRLDSITN